MTRNSRVFGVSDKKSDKKEGFETEDDIQRKKLGPRGVDPAKMTPQQEKNIPKSNEPGHTA
jgi:hypothetical protein